MARKKGMSGNAIGNKGANDTGNGTPDKQRIWMTLSGDRLALAMAATPEDGSLADGVRALIDIAARADSIEHQNRELSRSMAGAIDNMAGALREIKSHLARIELERIEWQAAAEIALSINTKAASK